MALMQTCDVPAPTSTNSRPKRPARSHLDLLIRILDTIILAHRNLLLLLRHRMLHPHLLRMLRHVLPYVAWIPQLRRHAQVLAAAHQRVGLAPLGGGGDAVRVEVVLFAAGDGDESFWRDMAVSDQS